MPGEMREGFTFFRSYYEAAKELNDKQRLAFYDAIIAYALEDEEPNLKGVPKSCFVLVKPVLDKSIARAKAGSKGGQSKKPEPDKQSASKREANPNQSPTHKDKDEDYEKEYEEDKDTTPPIPPKGIENEAAGPGEPSETPMPEFEEDENPKPRRRKPSTLTKTQEGRFNRFWTIYPRKVSIGDAEKAWAKIDPDEELTATIIEAVKTAMRLDNRFREVRYTPHPASWLNAKSWANQYDGPEDKPQEGGGDGGRISFRSGDFGRGGQPGSESWRDFQPSTGFKHTDPNGQ